MVETAEEYKQFFGVTAQSVHHKKLLDCAAGSASFTAELGAMGVDVTACDPLYEKSAVALAKKGNSDIDYMLGQMKKAEGQFDWSFYGDLDKRAAFAHRALDTFVADFKNHPARYIAGCLPNLPFADKTFDLVLSSHFLFVYEEKLDPKFHIAAVRELLRVAKTEVRIYPLVMANGKASREVNKVISAMPKRGVSGKTLALAF